MSEREAREPFLARDQGISVANPQLPRSPINPYTDDGNVILSGDGQSISKTYAGLPSCPVLRRQHRLSTHRYEREAVWGRLSQDYNIEGSSIYIHKGQRPELAGSQHDADYMSISAAKSTKRHGSGSLLLSEQIGY